MRGVHTQLRPFLKVVPEGCWAHSWCPTVVICIFPSKMDVHKRGLVEMQQTWATLGVSVCYLVTGDLPSNNFTLHKLNKFIKLNKFNKLNKLPGPALWFFLQLPFAVSLKFWDGSVTTWVNVLGEYSSVAALSREGVEAWVVQEL